MLIVFLFVVLIIFLVFATEPTNLEKSHFQIFGKHDENSIYLTICV